VDPCLILATHEPPSTKLIRALGNINQLANGNVEFDANDPMGFLWLGCCLDNPGSNSDFRSAGGMANGAHIGHSKRLLRISLSRSV
jgi:hypothetical protein